MFSVKVGPDDSAATDSPLHQFERIILERIEPIP